MCYSGPICCHPRQFVQVFRFREMSQTSLHEGFQRDHGEYLTPCFFF